jgi:NADPH:quinone reductase-like Zn-dependent oxidoreductase
MKAVVAENYGSPDVLRLQDVGKPTPKANEILVRVRATTVNVGDSRMRSFDVPPALWLPSRIALGWTKPRQPIYGMELAGVVEGVGKAVTRFQVGDEVFASTLFANFGAHAEYKCLAEDAAVAAKPRNMTFEEAAPLAIGANAALFFLKAAGIRRGQKVLINGASGTVGSYAVQLAKYFGAEVSGVSGTNGIQLVKKLGAEHAIDYTREDFTQNGVIYDVIFDAVGKTTFAQVQNSLKENGFYLHTILPGAPIQGPWVKLTTGKHIIGGTASASGETLGFLKDLVEQGQLKTVIDRCYPLEQIVEAYRFVESGQKTGSVVITLS